MNTVLAVLRPGDGDVDGLCARLRALGDDDRVPIQSSRAEVHLAGVVAPPGLGVGAITWECVGDRRARDILGHAVVDTLLRSVAVETAVTLLPLSSGYVETTAPLVKRTLLLRVRPDASTAARERFQADLAAMPNHISTIRSWRLSRVVGTGPTRERWTHVWEQEFETLDGLTGEYMTNPYHWTTVDRWFDAEVPEHVVEPELAHLFAERNDPWARAELEVELPTSSRGRARASPRRG
jgi:hypothetical protein